MAYGLQNGHVTGDVTWLWKVKLLTPIHLERKISKTTWARDFKFGKRLWLIIIIWLSGSAYYGPLWGSTVGYPSDSLASCYSFTLYKLFMCSAAVFGTVSYEARAKLLFFQ